jgi:hypothetical protein
MPYNPDNSTGATPDGRQAAFGWGLAAAAVLLAAMAAPSLVGRVSTRDDLGAFHLPIRAFYAGQLARGEAFDWMPQLFCGFYLTGEGQAGTYHPWHWLLYRFLPLDVAWAVELWVSYPFLLVGMYLFLRRKLGGRDAAIFGSLAFTFSGFMLLRFVHPNAVAVSAHIPWLLWAIDVLLLDERRGRAAAAVAAVAVLTGSQILLGYPQYVWFSLLAETAYAVMLVASRPEARRGVRLLRLAGAKAAGVMLGGVQLLPTIEALGHSVRQAADAPFVNSGSLHPLNLVQLVAPYFFAHRVAGQSTHELGLYLGAVPLVLAAWLVAVRADLGRLRGPALAASGAGLAAILMAFGKYGPVYRLQQFVPLAAGFRFPSRYLLLFSLAAAVVAAIGFALLARRDDPRRALPRGESIAIWLPALAAAAAAGVGLALEGSPFVAAPAAVLAGPALVGLASLLVCLAARGTRGALVALVLFTAIDLGFYGLSYAVYPGAMRLHDYAQSVAVPPGRDGRVLADAVGPGSPGLKTGNQLLLAGLERADGYAGLEPSRQLDYGRLPDLQAAGVRWVQCTPSTAAIEGLLPGRGAWSEVPGPLPRVRLVGRAVTSDDPGRTMAEIPVATAAVVDEPLCLGGGEPGSATVVAEGPGRIEVRVDAPAPQLLVVSESYHPGWTVRVDGHTRHAWPVNGDFLGCPVEAGEHDVCFAFAPESLRRGRIVSLLGAALMSVLAVGCWFGDGPYSFPPP